MEKKGTPASPETAFASNVFPVPGCPTSKTPLGIRAPKLINFSGSLRNSTISCNSCLASSAPATSLKVTGYVLLAFLRNDFVIRLGWLTDQQLLDAVAVGQITPGPLFTAATFIGYLLGGVPVALLATLGIFLPSFIFVAISNPLIPKIRNSAWASSLLDGVNASALGLMAAVTVQLGISSLIDLFTLVIAIISLILLLRYKVNSTWLIAGGAIAGLLFSFIR